VNAGGIMDGTFNIGFHSQVMIFVNKKCTNALGCVLLKKVSKTVRAISLLGRQLYPTEWLRDWFGERQDH